MLFECIALVNKFYSILFYLSLLRVKNVADSNQKNVVSSLLNFFYTDLEKYY